MKCRARIRKMYKTNVNMAMQYKLNLSTLIKYLDEEHDGDELYLKVDGKRIFPYDKKFFKMSSEALLLDLKFPVEELGKWIKIELWEYNFVFSDVLLGSFQLFMDKYSENETFIADLHVVRGTKAKYSLTWGLKKVFIKEKTIL